MQGDRKPRFGLHAACVLLLAAVHLQSARAQEPVVQGLAPNVPFEQHLVRQWTADDGLPSNVIRDVVQTSDGHLWIATQAGLSRFDGRHFKTFNRANEARLAANDVRALHESRDGSLWIGTVAGLTRYMPGRPGVFQTIEPLAGYHVSEIFEDRSGTIWIGTRTETWSSKKNGDFELHASAPKHVNSICQDQASNLWVGSGFGLYRLRDREFVRCTAAEGAPPAVVDVLGEAHVSALFAEDGKVWIGTKRGLLRHEDEQFKLYADGLNEGYHFDILRTRSDSLYVVTSGGGLTRWTGDSLEACADLGGACLAEGREGSLWVGLTDGGLRQYRNNWTSLALPGQRVHCVHQDRSGNMWFGTNAGLRRMNDGVVTNISDGLPHPIVRTIAAGKDALWIGTRKGLARWSDQTITVVPGTKDLDISTVYEDSAGVVWIGLFGTGGYRLQGESLKVVEELDGHVHWFYEDAGGVLWIGNDYGLCRQVGKQIEIVDDPNLERLSSATLSHYADGNDLWLGGMNGIARYRAGRFDVFDSQDGLLAERIQQMHGDSHGNLWMVTPQGIFYASLQELDDFAAGRADRINCHWIEQEYEQTIQAEMRSFPRACKSSDGTTWIAGLGGVLKVHADPIPVNLLSPPVIIEQAIVDGEVADANGSFELMSGRHQVEFNFAVPTFFRPQRAEVKYRLSGYDDDWIDANGDRIATYSNLHPGDYQFQVIAHNGDGVWNKEGVTLRFSVTPRWFETLWFRGLCLMTGIGMVLGVLQWRITAVRRQHEEQQQHQEELNRASRIATMGQLTASIAHEVNQPLCAILNDANSGQRLLSSEEIDVTEATETFQDIAAAAKRASDVITHIRELLSKHSTERVVVNVVQLIRESLHLVRPELARKGIQLEVDTEPEPSLTNVLGDHVQLQQVLINLILNASDSIDSTEDGPRVVRVRTDTRENQLEISVRDTGAGFGPDDNVNKLFEPFYTTKPEGIGMGLAITHSIIRAHDGSVRAERNDDRGATFIVTLPILSGGTDE